MRKCSTWIFLFFFSLSPFQPSPQGVGRQKCSSHATHFLSFSNTCSPFLPLRFLLLFSLSVGMNVIGQLQTEQKPSVHHTNYTVSASCMEVISSGQGIGVKCLSCVRLKQRLACALSPNKCCTHSLSQGFQSSRQHLFHSV